MDKRGPKKKNSWTCKAPPAESIRASDVICCNLDTKNCAKETSRLRGFCDGVAVEAFVNKGGKLRVATAFDLPALSPFSASLSALSLAFWASFSALSVAFLAFLSLCLRILFYSFSGSRLRSTSTSSSCSWALSMPMAAVFESAFSQAFLTSSSLTRQ
jgi:hypothetical protein